MTQRVCIHCGTRYPANRECPRHPREPRPAWRTTAGTKQSRGYDATHDHLRRTILAQHPICQECATHAATIADHIVNQKRGGTNTLDNYQALCTRCHKRKTAREAHA